MYLRSIVVKLRFFKTIFGRCLKCWNLFDRQNCFKLTQNPKLQNSWNLQDSSGKFRRCETNRLGFLSSKLHERARLCYRGLQLSDLCTWKTYESTNSNLGDGTVYRKTRRIPRQKEPFIYYPSIGHHLAFINTIQCLILKRWSLT